MGPEKRSVRAVPAMKKKKKKKKKVKSFELLRRFIETACMLLTSIVLLIGAFDASRLAQLLLTRFLWTSLGHTDAVTSHTWTKLEEWRPSKPTLPNPPPHLGTPVSHLSPALQTGLHWLTEGAFSAIHLLIIRPSLTLRWWMASAGKAS